MSCGLKADVRDLLAEMQIVGGGADVVDEEAVISSAIRNLHVSEEHVRELIDRLVRTGYAKRTVALTMPKSGWPW